MPNFNGFALKWKIKSTSIFGTISDYFALFGIF